MVYTEYWNHSIWDVWISTAKVWSCTMLRSIHLCAGNCHHAPGKCFALIGSLGLSSFGSASSGALCQYYYIWLCIATQCLGFKVPSMFDLYSILIFPRTWKTHSQRKYMNCFEGQKREIRLDSTKIKPEDNRLENDFNGMQTFFIKGPKMLILEFISFILLFSLLEYWLIVHSIEYRMFKFGFLSFLLKRPKI